VPFIKKMKEQNHEWIKNQKSIICPFDIPETIEDKDLLPMLLVRGQNLIRYHVNYKFLFKNNLFIYFLFNNLFNYLLNYLLTYLSI